jgi:hypothetical protein
MPRQDLPQDRWDRRDLSMLEGCWHKYTSMATYNYDTGQAYRVRDWTLCFDRQGRGSQTITYDDGNQCRNPLRAEFTADTRLLIKDLSRCQGGRGLLLTESSCQRVSDTEAVCNMRDREGPNAGKPGVEGRFRR